jgi:hypothetical protein
MGRQLGVLLVSLFQLAIARDCCAGDPGADLSRLKVRLAVAEHDVAVAEAAFGKALPSIPEYKDLQAAIDDLDRALEAARAKKDEAAVARDKLDLKKRRDRLVAELKAKFLAPAKAKVDEIRAEIDKAYAAKVAADAAIVKIPKMVISELKSGQVGRLIYPDVRARGFIIDTPPHAVLAGSAEAAHDLAEFRARMSMKPVAERIVKAKVIQVESESELLISVSWDDGDLSFWLSGVPTKDRVDGSEIDLDGIFEVVGKKKYRALLGERTVFEIKPISEKDAAAKLQKN